MPAYIIPTIFTAINQISRPTGVMSASLMAMRAQAERAQASFDKFSPTLSRTTSGMLEYAKSAAGVTAVLSSIALTGRSILDTQDAIASFRTIVSDLNDVQFEPYKEKVRSVALDTRRGADEVAASFEKIAGLNAKFADTADNIGMVATSAITLGKAARMGTDEAAESLVNIMNQYSFAANQASRTANVLAAGQAVGAATIRQTSEAMVNFGSTAAGANITLEQSVGLIQTMAKYGMQGAIAGDRLRSSIIKIQQAGVGYKSGRFEITDALEDLRKRYDALGTAQAKDAFLTNIFGLEQITAGRILLTNIGTFKEFTSQVTNTNEVTKAAAINSATLSVKAKELANRFTTVVSTSDFVGNALSIAGSGLGFLANNMDTLLALVPPVLTFFGVWKSYILLTTLRIKALTLAQTGLNFVQGIATVVNKEYATACFASTAGMNGMAAASFFMERGLLGSIVTMGYVGVAIGALTALFFRHKLTLDDLQPANDKTAAGFVKVDKAITAAQANLALYNDAMRSYNENQTGLAKIQAIRRYHEQKGTTGSWAELFDELPYYKVRNDMPKPRMSDYMSAADSAMIVEQARKDSIDAHQAPAMPAQPQSMQGKTSSTYNQTSNTVELHVIPQQGSEVKVAKNTGNIPIKITPTNSWG